MYGWCKGRAALSSSPTQNNSCWKYQLLLSTMMAEGVILRNLKHFVGTLGRSIYFIQKCWLGPNGSIVLTEMKNSPQKVPAVQLLNIERRKSRAA